MSGVDLFLCALTVLDVHAKTDEGTAAAAAEWVTSACKEESSCIVAAAVIWGTETGHTFTLTPSTKHAFGPMQVIPSSAKQPGRELVDPEVGFRAGVRIWLLKVKRAGGVSERAFRFYNGHPKHQDSYGRNAWRRYKKAVSVCSAMTRV